MSVPGRIGTILIIVLALLDGLILGSGARRTAEAVATRTMDVPPVIRQARDEPLLSTAIREINLLTTIRTERPRRI